MKCAVELRLIHGLSLFSILSVAGCSDSGARPSKLDLAEDGVHNVTGEALQADFEREGDYLLSPVFEVEQPAQRTGFMVDLEDLKLEQVTRLEARGWVDGEPGVWHEAEITWWEDPLFVARVDFDFDATSVQIRVHAHDAHTIANLSWAGVTLPVEAEGQAGGSTTSQALSAVGAGTPGVISRDAWGARDTKCTSLDSARDRLTIHHTVTPTQSGGSYEKRVRAIQAFHLDVRGWCDVGYHYLVSASGEVYEGRPAPDRGAHVSGATTGNLGIAFVGCFQADGCNGWGTEVPPEEMLVGAAHLIEQLALTHGLSVNDATVIGHRDHPTAQTACPGDNLYAELQNIRNEVNALISEPVEEEPVDPCGGVTYTGQCDGDRLSFCADGALYEYDCGNTGSVCAWQNDSIGYNCLASADPCDGLDYYGTCEGSLLRYCSNDTLHEYDCATSGRSCGWQSSSIGYNCL